MVRRPLADWASLLSLGLLALIAAPFALLLAVWLSPVWVPYVAYRLWKRYRRTTAA